MKTIWSIYIRDLKSTSHSFIAYILVAFFVAIVSYFFVSLTTSFSIMSQQWKTTPGVQDVTFNLTDIVLSNLYFNVAVLVILFVPLLTMRSFSEEKKQGTLELLLTLPIKDYQLVLGKYLSVLTIFILMILPLLMFPLLIQFVGGFFEWPTVITGFIGLVLLGTAFSAIGVFISSLTSNQVVSAVITSGILLMLWVIGWVENYSQSSLAEMTFHLSALSHFKSLAKGVLDVKDVGYYFLVTVFFLYLTIFKLEARTLKK